MGLEWEEHFERSCQHVPGAAGAATGAILAITCVMAKIRTVEPGAPAAATATESRSNVRYVLALSSKMFVLLQSRPLQLRMAFLKLISTTVQYCLNLIIGV